MQRCARSQILKAAGPARAGAIDLELTPAEAMMLRAVPGDRLEAIIAPDLATRAVSTTGRGSTVIPLR